MKKRLTFQCCNPSCKKTYTLQRELDGVAQLFVQCPYCEKEAVVELDPYRKPVVDIYRSVDPPKSGASLVLPDVIPTAPKAEA